MTKSPEWNAVIGAPITAITVYHTLVRVAWPSIQLDRGLAAVVDLDLTFGTGNTFTLSAGYESAVSIDHSCYNQLHIPRLMVCLLFLIKQLHRN